MKKRDSDRQPVPDRDRERGRSCVVTRDGGDVVVHVENLQLAFTPADAEQLAAGLVMFARVTRAAR